MNKTISADWGLRAELQNTVESQVDRLRREHGELKARLVELNSRLYLSPREEVEKKQLQKLKLQKKDQLAFLGG